MRLHSNRAVLFLPDGKFLICDNLDDVKGVDANPCTKMQFYGTMNLDPTGQFPEGPDAAVEYTPAIEADSYYYLFKGQRVSEYIYLMLIDALITVYIFSLGDMFNSAN